MTVLVTGSTGFLGKHLVSKLFSEYEFEDIVTVSRNRLSLHVANNENKKHTHYLCDLGNPDPNDNLFKRICDKHKPETIFHLASTPVVKVDESNVHQIILNNIVSTQKVVHHAPQDCRVVLASTVIVYGDWWVGEHDKCVESLDTRPTSAYGITKRASESFIESYTNMGRIDGVSARLCATVGEGVTHGVMKDFIRKLKSDNPNLEALGSAPGSNKPYCHVDDTLSALVLLAKSGGNTEYNVAPDDSVSIEDMAYAVMEGCGITKPIKWLGETANWKGDNRVISVDNSRLKSIGWNPKFPKSKDAIIDIVRKIS